MIGYITLGTNDLMKAAAFYDDLLAKNSAGWFMQEVRFVTWAVANVFYAQAASG